MVNRVESGETDGGAGFRIGLKSELNEYRINCFVVDGIRAGWMGDQLGFGFTTFDTGKKPTLSSPTVFSSTPPTAIPLTSSRAGR